jgi:hypothetical protein
MDNETLKIKIIRPLPLDKNDCSLSVGDVVDVIKCINGRPLKYFVKDPKTNKKLYIFGYEAEAIH